MATSPPSVAVAGSGRRTAAAALVGLVVTVVVVSLPTVRLAYRSPEGHLVIETAVGLVAGLVGLLLYGRFRRSGALQELLLVHSMLVFAVAALGFVAIPLVVGATSTSPLTTWAPMTARLSGALLLLAASLVAGRQVTRPLHFGREALVVVATLVGLAVVVEVVSVWLPAAVVTQPPPETSTRPNFDEHPVVAAVQIAQFGCFAVAAVAFTRQARRTGDDLVAWFAAAAVLGAWARVHYLLFPSLYSEWLYTGDFLRLGFYLLLLVGAVREVRSYWQARAELAVFAERRRLARDLHDGAVQELGFIRSQARLVHDPVGERIVAAADRALDETRRAIAALAAPPGETVADAVRRAVHEVADRYDVDVVFTAAAPPPGDERPERREALVRIAREAVANAARHGHVDQVRVTLERGRLAVQDEGEGFDVARAGEGGGFGLVSMRDRAAAVDGALTVTSAPGGGTTVEVTW